MMVEIRRAELLDASRMASLHCDRISEGFLPSLGVAFLRRIYGRIVRTEHSFAYVAVDRNEVIGFVAATESIGGFYRTFMIRDGIRAGLRAAPRIVLSAKRVWETLRYPASASGATSDLPTAEIIAVSVARSSGKRGIGRLLVDAVSGEMDRRHVSAVKVVAATDNAAAAALYLGAGYTELHEISVHGSTASTVFVRRSDPTASQDPSRQEPRS